MSSGVEAPQGGQPRWPCRPFAHRLPTVPAMPASLFETHFFLCKLTQKDDESRTRALAEFS